MESITLHTPLAALPGVGPAREKALGKLGLHTVADLLAYFPREYEDRTLRGSIASLPLDEPVCFSALVAEPFRASHIRRGMELVKGRVVDGTGQVDVTFFNQSYVRHALEPGVTYHFYGKLTGVGRRKQLVTPPLSGRGRDSIPTVSSPSTP